MIVNMINNAPDVASHATTHTRLGGNRGVLEAADTLLRNNESFALIIVVSTQGSTYRKPGALALIAQNGTTQSVISGGCLEPTLHDIAMRVIQNNSPEAVHLDTSTDDDLIFGSGSGCRGKMRVLVIPVIPTDVDPVFQAISSSHLDRQPLNLALAIDPTHCTQGIAWNTEQQWCFGISENDMKRFCDLLVGEHPLRLSESDHCVVAAFTINPAPRLLIIGASVEVPALIRMARILGWHSTVVDHRDTQLATHASEADDAIHSRPIALHNELDAKTFDAALIMSHSASTDLEALQLLASRSERYVGLLGPPARRDELLTQLSEAQRASLSSRLHAPLGLRLGGDGPESLALSITAELQRCFHEQ